MNYAVIMAGGSGQRLWPLSRQSKPKQIIELCENKSLLRHCVDRVADIFPAERVLVVTNAEYAAEVHRHLPEIPKENILGEPVGRDTANAIGLAAVVLEQRNVGAKASMAVFSADQIIHPIEPLQQALLCALKFLETHPEALFTFGIKPTSAHTEFGYLKRGEESVNKEQTIYPVAAFREKPNKNTARQYIRSGKYCWNSGIFAWRVETIIQQLQRFLPHNMDRLTRIAKGWDTPDRDSLLATLFPSIERISIDYAVMEHARKVYMCELDCHWVDVGSFEALADTVGTRDEDDNIAAGGIATKWLDSSNNIAISEKPGHLVAGIGVENMIVVHTEDATFICHRNDVDSIKRLLATMETPEYNKFL